MHTKDICSILSCLLHEHAVIKMNSVEVLQLGGCVYSTFPQKLGTITNLVRLKFNVFNTII